ncbi:Uma2 family endonuclease [Clostridium sp. CS001]|uniref:Uma2 family endonuclease n=1 Tax=Clostridium sp. CS001 TaxID=2880648 RepID=UPI001CF1B6C6|nr:Uma2 family endonuclease [Clostridium sp. CS001]MCB2291558.1 Uma2 family endonuclease [Clostridium sp. CS001]
MENNLIKEEWINGNIMMSPRPQYNHIEINGELYSNLKNYFNGKCKVVMEGSLFLTKDNPNDVKRDLNKLKELISGKGAELVPDIAVYCDKQQIFKRGFLGVPQLVVEVLSPSNSEDDTIKKKDIYEKFGVPEYWIASPMSKIVYVYNLEDGRYNLAGEYKFLEQDIKSSRFDDLVVDIKNIDLFECNEDDDIIF